MWASVTTSLCNQWGASESQILRILFSACEAALNHSQAAAERRSIIYTSFFLVEKCWFSALPSFCHSAISRAACLRAAFPSRLCCYFPRVFSSSCFVWCLCLQCTLVLPGPSSHQYCSAFLPAREPQEWGLQVRCKSSCHANLLFMLLLSLSSTVAKNLHNRKKSVAIIIVLHLLGCLCICSVLVRLGSPEKLLL